MHTEVCEHFAGTASSPSVIVIQQCFEEEQVESRTFGVIEHENLLVLDIFQRRHTEGQPTLPITL